MVASTRLRPVCFQLPKTVETGLSLYNEPVATTTPPAANDIKTLNEPPSAIRSTLHFQVPFTEWPDWLSNSFVPACRLAGVVPADSIIANKEAVVTVLKVSMFSP